MAFPMHFNIEIKTLRYTSVVNFLYIKECDIAPIIPKFYLRLYNEKITISLKWIITEDYMSSKSEIALFVY